MIKFSPHQSKDNPRVKSSTRAQRIFLTGASGVIGRAIAKTLAKPGVGFFLTHRPGNRLVSLKKELEAAGSKVCLLDFDLEKPESSLESMEKFFKDPEPFMALVCAAGQLGYTGSFIEADLNKWRRSFDANFWGNAVLINTFAQKFKQQRISAGSIVTFSGAGLGAHASLAGVSSYSTAKAALTHLIEALSQEFVPLGITINAVAPGAVLSRMTEQAISAGTERLGAYATSAIECQTTGGVSPQLAADLVEFLLSPLARRISGRLLSARFDQKRLHENIQSVIDDANLFRLRRIDNELFSPHVKGNAL